METSQASTLPTFKLGDVYETPIGKKPEPQKVVEVMCQRSWCQGVFVVVVKKWWAKNIWETKKANGEVASRSKLRTRPCPYCCNMHKLPKRPKNLR